MSDLKPVEAHITERRYAAIPNRGTGYQAYVELHEGEGRMVEITEGRGKHDRKGNEMEPASVLVQIDQLREALDLAEKLLEDN